LGLDISDKYLALALELYKEKSSTTRNNDGRVSKRATQRAKEIRYMRLV